MRVGNKVGRKPKSKMASTEALREAMGAWMTQQGSRDLGVLITIILYYIRVVADCPL